MRQMDINVDLLTLVMKHRSGCFLNLDASLATFLGVLL